LYPTTCILYSHRSPGVGGILDKVKTREGKQEILHALREGLNDDATLEDAIDYLWYLHKVEEGLQEVETEKMIPHAEVMNQMDQWIK